MDRPVVRYIDLDSNSHTQTKVNRNQANTALLLSVRNQASVSFLLETPRFAVSANEQLGERGALADTVLLGVSI